MILNIIAYAMKFEILLCIHEWMKTVARIHTIVPYQICEFKIIEFEISHRI